MWFDAVREGVPGASGQFDLKASQVQSLLTDKPRLLDCDHLMSHHIALQSVLGKRESKAGTLFPQFLSDPGKPKVRSMGLDVPPRGL